MFDVFDGYKPNPGPEKCLADGDGIVMVVFVADDKRFHRKGWYQKDFMPQSFNPPAPGIGAIASLHGDIGGVNFHELTNKIRAFNFLVKQHFSIFIKTTNLKNTFRLVAPTFGAKSILTKLHFMMVVPNDFIDLFRSQWWHIYDASWE